MPDNAADHRLEQTLGRVLQIGVFTSAAVVGFGAVLLLASRAYVAPLLTSFTGVRAPLRTVPGILGGAAAFQPDALVQLGLVLLIATPLLRVVLSLFGFIRRRDWIYTAVSLIVTGVLVAGLIGK